MLTLERIEKAFDEQPVLKNVSLEIGAGEVVVLLGPSGCGKTTLLRIIAGLDSPDKGRVLLEGQDLTPIPVHERGFGMVFQDYALFPHKNVFDNVAFGLRMLGWGGPAIRDRVAQVLALVDMVGFAERPIYELSGGEQQRVALARSLAPAPRLLLLDEPLGALDRALRERLMLDLRQILQQAGSIVGRPEGITAVYVTHDQTEAFAIADRVAVMNNGRIEQEGAPTNLYQKPRTPFVARFLGMSNILSGEIVSVSPLIIRSALGDLELAASEAADEPGSLAALHQQVTFLIRPDAGRLLPAGAVGGRNLLTGQLADLSFRGRYQVASILALPSSIALELEFDTAVLLPPLDKKFRIGINPDNIQLLTSG